MKSVYIVSWVTLGLDHFFQKRGWKVFRDKDIKEGKNPDLVCFTGGADISPEYYNEKCHERTHFSPERDSFEFAVYKQFVGKKPMAGVCRGGQLLNIANGGKMYQHVNNHAGRNHLVHDVKGRQVMVSSAHHQMMIPPENKGVVIGWSMMSTRKETFDEALILPDPEPDPEVIWFDDNKHLAFQAHPEFGPQSCTDYFFTLVKEKIGM